MDVEDDKAAARVVDEPATAPLPIHALIDEWFATHFSNSIVSRDTEIYNHVHAAKEDLKRRVSQGDH